MNKRSVFFKIGIAFAGLYALYSILFFVYYINDSYKKMTEQSFEAASNYAKIGSVLLRNDEVLDLSERLAHAIEMHEIDYYLIRQGDKDLVYENAAGTDDPIVFVKNGREGQYETPEYRHFLIREKGYELTVGTKTSRWFYARKAFQRDESLIVKDIAFVTILVFSLVFYSFRDLRNLIRRLKKRGVKRSEAPLVRSSEALTLIQGLKGYENKIATLSSENAILKDQVLPALKNELWSGLQPPYDFQCTLARVDINNFTTIFSGPEKTHFMGVINRFFIEITHIVSRYGGFVYEFIGDEVIFYFKEVPGVNSAAVAISALRDINAVAEKFHESTLAERGYPFRVKSSLAYGTLHFGPLVNGFALAGNPLIETVRILSHIHEKTENTILFDDVIRDRISSLCLSVEHKVVILKGLARARHLHQYQSHVPLSHHLRQGKIENLEATTYYRSDADIAEILDFTRMNFPELDKGIVICLMALFRKYHVTRVSTEVRKSYLNLLEQLIPEASVSPDEKTRFSLASVIASAAHIFIPGSFNERIRSKLLECLEIDDRRIVANAVDVFSELESSANEEIFERLISHGDNRVVANSLVKDGKRDWNRRVARRLGALLKSRSPFAKSSALYAIGEIAQSVRSQDPVAFETDTELQGLLGQLAKFAFHPNRMVRSQAMIAIEKLAWFEPLLQFDDGNLRGAGQEAINEVRTFLQNYRLKMVPPESAEQEQAAS